MNVRRFECDMGGGVEPRLIRQCFSHRNDRVRAVIFITFGTCILLPFALIAHDAAARVHFHAMMTSNPFAVTRLFALAAVGFAGIALGAVLVATPKISKRHVRIAAERVRMLERVGRQIRSWSEPLAAFTGLRHKVMTTSNGPLHALMLEHADRSRSFPVAIETHISDRQISDLAKSWNLPVLAPNWAGVQDRSPGSIDRLLPRLLSETSALRQASR